MSVEGLVTIPSRHSVKETVDRLAAVLAEKGITVFARIDHAAGAEAVGMALRPTELLIFGNPKAGTPLMQARQTSGIDLPLKALAWQEEDGTVWLGANDVRWLARRHRLPESTETALAGLASVVKTLIEGAAA